VKHDDQENQKRGVKIMEGNLIFSVVDSEGTRNPFCVQGKISDGIDTPEFMDKIIHLTEKDDKKELRKWEKFETMLIVAEIPRPPDAKKAVAPSSENLEPEGGKESRSYHQPLMFIKYTMGGELEVQPNFASMHKGSQALYHIFESPYGDTWRYEIENVREVARKRIHQLQIQQQDAERFRLERFQNQVGQYFKPMPIPGELSVHIFTEIVSAESFVANQLYVEIFVELPKDWEPHQGSDAYITHHEVSTQFSKKNLDQSGVDKWHFGFPFELDLHRRSGANPVRTPRIYMCVNSIDTWNRHHVEGYGFVDVPSYAGMHNLRVHTWRPQGTVREQMRNFYLGGALQLGAVNYPPMADKLPGRVMNQHGFQTQTSGTVSLRIQVVNQHPRPPRTVQRGEAPTARAADYAAGGEWDGDSGGGDKVDGDLDMREALVARATKRLEEHQREREQREARMSSKKNLLARTASHLSEKRATSPMSLIAPGASRAGSPLKGLASRALAGASRENSPRRGGDSPRRDSPRRGTDSPRGQTHTKAGEGVHRAERGEHHRRERDTNNLRRTASSRTPREDRSGRTPRRGRGADEGVGESSINSNASLPTFGVGESSVESLGQAPMLSPGKDPNAPPEEPESPGSPVEWGTPDAKGMRNTTEL